MEHQTGVAKDVLTGLPGYEAFLHQFEERTVNAGKDSGPVSMALLDIDRFARLNEAYGPSVGDSVLKLLAGFLAECFSDTGAVFRYGGDAFAVLFEADKEEAFLLTERARGDFGGEHEVDADAGGVTLSVTVTAGVAAYPDDGAQAQEIARKANEALYRAKVSGPNKVCLAREEKMVTKTTHYAQGQLHGLSRLAKREGVGEAELLREALDDLLRKFNA